jgi:hypothetical protein
MQGQDASAYNFFIAIETHADDFHVHKRRLGHSLWKLHLLPYGDVLAAGEVRRAFPPLGSGTPLLLALAVPSDPHQISTWVIRSRAATAVTTGHAKAKYGVNQQRDFPFHHGCRQGPSVCGLT